jgi:hypothetical protein
MGRKPLLCYHNTTCFSEEQRCFYVLFYSLPLSAILCKLVHEQEQCDTSAVRNSKSYSP